MNIGILGTETIGQTIGIRFFEFAKKLSDSINALQVAAQNKRASVSSEKGKTEAKVKVPLKKTSPPKAPKQKPVKPKASKAKAPKPKASKLGARKTGTQKASLPEVDHVAVGEIEPKSLAPKMQETPIVAAVVEKLEPEIKEQEKQKVFVPIKEEVKKESPVSSVQRQTGRHDVPPKQVAPVARSSSYTPSSFGTSYKQKSNQRMWWIGGVIVFILMCGGFGLNYMKNRSAVPLEPSAPEISSTPVPTFTSEPFTATAVTLPTETIVPTETIAPTETPFVEPTIGVGSTIIGADGMILRYVPAGEFAMGSDANSDEQPIHSVTLDAYWIDQTEVTNAMYIKCVKANECKPPRELSSNTREIYFYNPGFGIYPVISVSWNDAVAYCSWIGRRLPTEAEWEKAARGTDGRIYPWGNDKPSANFINMDNSDTTEVGSYPDGASFYGVLDMSGNVWEWVADWYDKAYYQTSPSSNPLGPESGELRVLRGGSWFNLDHDVSSSQRYMNGPRFNLSRIGFRCSQSVTP